MPDFRDIQKKDFRPSSRRPGARFFNNLKGAALRQIDGDGSINVSRFGDRVSIANLHSQIIPDLQNIVAFAVLSEGYDFLQCVPYPYSLLNGSTLSPYFRATLASDMVAGGASVVPVAKPYLLQKTPWDGRSLTVGGLMYTYSYTGINTRLVCWTDAEMVAQAENQIITPAYFPGDIILATPLVATGLPNNLSSVLLALAANPSLDVEGNLSIACAEPHGLYVGQLVLASGFLPVGYNGAFVVTSVINASMFTISVPVSLGAITQVGTFLNAQGIIWEDINQAGRTWQNAASCCSCITSVSANLNGAGSDLSYGTGSFAEISSALRLSLAVPENGCVEVTGSFITYMDGANDTDFAVSIDGGTTWQEMASMAWSSSGLIVPVTGFYTYTNLTEATYTFMFGWSAGGTVHLPCNSRGAAARGTITTATVIGIGCVPVIFPPTITSADTATFTVGVSGTFTVTVTGSPTPSISETDDLPGDIFFNTATGVLSGTPGIGDVGETYVLMLTASNGISPDANQTLSLIVGSPPAASAAAFDGSTSYIDLGEQIQLYITTGPLSLSTWIQLTALPQPNGNLAIFLADNNASGIQIGIDSGSPYLGQTGGAPSVSSYSFTDTNYHHLVIVWNGTIAGTVSFYVDGSLIDTIPCTLTFAPGDKLIGAYGGYSLQGNLQCFALWNTALGSSDVTDLYNSGNGLFGSLTAAPYSNGSLIAGYNFNNDLTDFSTYGNTGSGTSITYTTGQVAV